MTYFLIQRFLEEFFQGMGLGAGCFLCWCIWRRIEGRKENVETKGE